VILKPDLYNRCKKEFVGLENYFFYSIHQGDIHASISMTFRARLTLVAPKNFIITSPAVSVTEKSVP
jgi:hypothetical protein